MVEHQAIPDMTVEGRVLGIVAVNVVPSNATGAETSPVCPASVAPMLSSAKLPSLLYVLTMATLKHWAAELRQVHPGQAAWVTEDLRRRVTRIGGRVLGVPEVSKLDLNRREQHVTAGA